MNMHDTKFLFHSMLFQKLQPLHNGHNSSNQIVRHTQKIDLKTPHIKDKKKYMYIYIFSP